MFRVAWVVTRISNWTGYIPKPSQDTEFSVSPGLNIKALVCNNGDPF